MTTQCPVCKSVKIVPKLTTQNIHGSTTISSKETFKYNQCLNCQALFITNITANKKYYEKYYKDYSLGKNNIGIIPKLLTKLSIKIREQIILASIKKTDSKIKILDIGSGDCQFLLNTSDQQFKKFAVEISNESNNIAKANNITLFNNDIFKIDFKQNKFDVITLWHVIEHLDQPTNLIKQLVGLLKKDGILCIATPNTDSLGFKFGKKFWFHLDAPRHLVLFNPNTMNKLATNSNMKITTQINENYTFPTDLYHSLKLSTIKIPIMLFYPLVKFFDHETTFFILKKND